MLSASPPDSAMRIGEEDYLSLLVDSWHPWYGVAAEEGPARRAWTRLACADWMWAVRRAGRGGGRVGVRRRAARWGAVGGLGGRGRASDPPQRSAAHGRGGRGVLHGPLRGPRARPVGPAAPSGPKPGPAARLNYLDYQARSWRNCGRSSTGAARPARSVYWPRLRGRRARESTSRRLRAALADTHDEIGQAMASLLLGI